MHDTCHRDFKKMKTTTIKNYKDFKLDGLIHINDNGNIIANNNNKTETEE